MNPEIKFEKLSISINKKSILTNFTLDLPQNTCLLIRGPSGSGKSTLLKALLGFIPFKGKIIVKNVPLTPKTANTCRLFFSYVPQNLNVFSGTLKDTLNEIFKAKANKKIGFSKGDFLLLLKEFGFIINESQILEKRWDEFSGGERQRILIAIAYFLKRDIMLLDEPTSALDESLKEVVVNFLNKLQKTIIVVSHDKAWEKLDNLKILEFQEGKWNIR